MEEQHISLYLKAGNSDKEYHLHLVPSPAGDGWLLNYQNGPRGKSLRSGYLISSPVPYEAARARYDKKVREQLKEGYTPGLSGVAYQDQPFDRQFCGIKPPKLKPISVDQTNVRLDDPSFIWEEKMDGERRMLIRDGGNVVGTNGEGLIVPVAQPLVDAVLSIPLPAFILDGEDMGEGRYAPFDLLTTTIDPKGGRPFVERKRHLLQLLSQAPSPVWVAIPSADTPDDARPLLKIIADRNGEGLVAKRADAGFFDGHQFKFKFIESATLLVLRQNAVRSVAVGAIDDRGRVVELGNVAIPANKAVPAPASIVEVCYLYAYRNGCLFQPVFKGVRTDKGRDECTLDQLKYRPETYLQTFQAEEEPSDDRLTM